jgi:predicted enzyme related to lactoylglutathione lyase
MKQELEKVAFTMLPVEDAKRARAFYEDVLGLTRGLAAPDGVWTEYDLPGGGCLALFRHPMPEHAMKPGGAAVAFEVADLDALNARLQAAGVEYRGDIVRGPHCRMSNIVDSEGNALILHQLDRKKPGAAARKPRVAVRRPASANAKKSTRAATKKPTPGGSRRSAAPRRRGRSSR